MLLIIMYNMMYYKQTMTNHAGWIRPELGLFIEDMELLVYNIHIKSEFQSLYSVASNCKKSG